MGYDLAGIIDPALGSIWGALMEYNLYARSTVKAS
jgi:hypothetical protein